MSWAQTIAFLATWPLLPGGVACGQDFGGSPPWGRETPTHFTGEIHRGEQYSQPIGGRFYFDMTPLNGGWVIGVSGSSDSDYSRCATPPFHGPNARYIDARDFREQGAYGSGAVGQKRQIDFVLSDEDDTVQFQQLDLALQGKSTFENRISGRCWFTPLSVKLSDGPPERQAVDSMRFEGDCALHGALELWRLPVTYSISNGFTGWVTVCFGAKDQPALTRTDDRYHLLVSKPGTVYTSSDLRQDSLGAKFESKDGASIPAMGPRQRIWGWISGEATGCQFQTFFVGTAAQYRKHASNPLLK